MGGKKEIVLLLEQCDVVLRSIPGRNCMTVEREGGGGGERESELGTHAHAR